MLTTPRIPAADALTTRTVNLVEEVLRAAIPFGPTQANILREKAARLETDLVEFERAFRRDRGKDARCPTARAWYLVTVLREHASLLGSES